MYFGQTWTSLDVVAVVEGFRGREAVEAARMDEHELLGRIH
jgi:hypothetical protein